MIDFEALRAPFPADRISWRIGSTNKDKNKGMALAYIDARDVQDRLDMVCGPQNWQCRYSHATDKKTVCEIGLLVDTEWIWKADGAGDTDVEAEKGALSDAFKRAAVRWGIGRYLYDLDSPWVEIEPRGRSYIIKPGEMTRLQSLLEGKRSEPKPAVPTPEQVKRAWSYAEEQSAILEKLTDQADFSAWHRKQANAVAKLRTIAPDAHSRLCEVIEQCNAKFSLTRAA